MRAGHHFGCILMALGALLGLFGHSMALLGTLGQTSEKQIIENTLLLFVGHRHLGGLYSHEPYPPHPQPLAST